MRVLITNDDGAHAPGLDPLIAALEGLGEVWVLTPEREQSAQSHAFTLHKPLRITELGPRRLALSGTPADCAYAGIHGLVPRPDLVVSGINRGANLGSDVHYSGTVAGAREATLQGVPAIAVSLHLRKEGGQGWATAAEVARRVALRVLSDGLPPGVLLNVNSPDLPLSELAGVRVARLGRRAYTAMVEERLDPRGRRYVWLGGKPIGEEPIPDSDVTWERRGWATVTPLRTDPTAESLIETLNGWF
jgi:5'-nucleotidase